MTQYYIDADNGLDTNDGLGTGSGNAWKTLDKYVEGTRTAGDICAIRRGTTARIDDASDVNPVSNGTLVSPITVEADYNDYWSDFITTAGETYTTVFGSKTITASATPDAAIVAGAWVYVSTDDNRLFAYEVASVVTNDITLYLPFKGTAGSGLTLIVMPAAPIWNTIAASFQVNHTTDDYWIYQGIEFTGTDGNGNFEVTAQGIVLKDCIFKPHTNDSGIEVDANATVVIRKCRFLDGGTGLNGTSTAAFGIAYIYDCLFDNPTTGILMSGALARVTVIETEFVNCTFDINTNNSTTVCGTVTRGRNVIFGGSTAAIWGAHYSVDRTCFIEDFDGVVGATRRYESLGTDNDTPIVESETTKVRSGGGATSIKITPSTDMGSVWDYSILKIFEYPIYATTASKTYTVYFASNTAADWTSDNPTATELWLEFEAWGHATNNYRKITKSTGTVDFATDTDFDQSLVVTVAPAQAGVAYLRLYYAKTKGAAAQIFYVDPQVVIS